MWQPFNEYFSEQSLNEVRYVLKPDTKGQLADKDGQTIDSEYFSTNEKPITFDADQVGTATNQFGDSYVFTNRKTGNMFYVPMNSVIQLRGGRGRAQPIAIMKREKDDVEIYKHPSYIQGAAITALSDFIFALAKPSHYTLTLTPEDVMDRLNSAKIRPTRDKILVDGIEMTSQSELRDRGIDFDEYIAIFDELKKTKDIKGLLNKLAAGKKIEWLNLMDTDQGFNVIKKSDKMGLERDPDKPGQYVPGAVEKFLGKDVGGEREYAAHQQGGGTTPDDTEQKFNARVQGLRDAWKKGTFSDNASDELIQLKVLANDLYKQRHPRAQAAIQTVKKLDDIIGAN